MAVPAGEGEYRRPLRARTVRPSRRSQGKLRRLVARYAAAPAAPIWNSNQMMWVHCVAERRRDDERDACACGKPKRRALIPARWEDRRGPRRSRPPPGRHEREFEIVAQASFSRFAGALINTSSMARRMSAVIPVTSRRKRRATNHGNDRARSQGPVIGVTI